MSELAAPQGCRVTFLSETPGGLRDLALGRYLTVLVEPLSPERDQLRVAAVVRRFGLAAAEERALSGLVAGHGVREIAELHGLSVETVRSQMKSLYSKTGTSGQTDLLRLLLRH